MIISEDSDGYTRVYSENGKLIGIFEPDEKEQNVLNNKESE